MFCDKNIDKNISNATLYKNIYSENKNINS